MRSVLPSLLLCLIAARAHAELVEIPLPGLLGAYPVDEFTVTRAVTFQLPHSPDVIHAVSLRIAGTASVGVADCGQVGEANLWPLEFIADMDDTPGHEWQATHAPVFFPGFFTWTAAFEPVTDGATWDFLMDGEGAIRLSGAPWTQLTVCSPVVLPAGSVTEAALIVDAQFPLGARSSTWGRIKALYR